MINLQKVVIASFTLVTLVLLLILHFQRHFSITFSRVLQCKSCVIPQQEGVYFMPMAFTLYIIFEIILCIIIICRDTILITDKYATIDQILIYSVILLPVWESSFNFYRFYSTYYASKKVVLLSNKQISIKFMYFGTTFIAIFLLQIHMDILYYLFPIIMAYHFIFNIICAWLFAHIMIVQYRVVMCNSSYLTNIHDDMLQSVYFMRKISIIASVNSSIFVGLILINQGAAIVSYAPFLWNISTICLALNFVNNRHFLKHYQLTYYKAYLNCKIRLNCNQPTKIHKHISKPPKTAQSQPASQIAHKPPLSADIHTTHDTILEDQCNTPNPVQPTLILTLNTGATSSPKSADRDPSISSNDKPKLWYQHGLVSIGTPGSETNTPKDRLLNPQTMQEVLPNNRDHDRNNSNKALKMLGIQMYHGRVIRVPTTPIPGFLDHLYTQPKTSNAVFYVVRPVGLTELIPVSSCSELKMRPIAVQINDNTNYKRAKRKQSAPGQKNDKNSLSKAKLFARIATNNENIKIINNIKRVNFAKDDIDEVDRKRARTLSVKTCRETKLKNKNENHVQAHSVNLNGFNPPKTPDIHVLDSFKLLAKHGLYSDANIASAEQLRNYTMNRTMTV